MQTVSWSQFNREPLPGRNFTFWEWFYALLKLTKDWLQGPWKERYGWCVSGTPQAGSTHKIVPLGCQNSYRKPHWYNI